MSISSHLSEIAFAETIEHKLHHAWKYLSETGTCYTNRIEDRLKSPETAVKMIHAHGRYGKRSEALKKIDAMEIVCAFLSVQGGDA